MMCDLIYIGLRVLYCISVIYAHVFSMKYHLCERGQKKRLVCTMEV